MRFKKGQQIVCVNDNYPNKDINGPKRNEIVTCAGYSALFPGSIYVKEYEYASDGMRQSIADSHFEPLMDIYELQSILETQPQEI